MIVVSRLKHHSQKHVTTPTIVIVNKNKGNGIADRGLELLGFCSVPGVGVVSAEPVAATPALVPLSVLLGKGSEGEAEEGAGPSPDVSTQFGPGVQQSSPPLSVFAQT
jgi:hypothetical protein